MTHHRERRRKNEQTLDCKRTLYDSGLSSITNLGDATLMLIPRSASDCNTSVYLQARHQRNNVMAITEVVLLDDVGGGACDGVRAHSRAFRLLLRLRARPAPWHVLGDVRSKSSKHENKRKKRKLELKRQYCLPAERFLHAFVCSSQNVAAGAFGSKFLKRDFSWARTCKCPLCRQQAQVAQ
jgi:hypothetical protein